ncbi:hypothetical protein NLI96_g6311 [Meripilus lineatus]|uniref:Uncharacterized protein n=1 Tax=Meripilus lineatus TaxID=2056292 RepID=A0AAD5YE05_9APHY|nr:hypothetical protein NLI96_g6311 [Physisporinus lineatus]
MEPAPSETFVVGGIYLAMFVLGSVDAGLYMAIYHHTGQNGGGKRHGIVGSTESGWVLASRNISLRGFTQSLVGLMRIGSCSVQAKEKNAGMEYASEMDNIVKDVKSDKVPKDFTELNCISWTLTVVKECVTKGLVKCGDVEALGLEALTWAEENRHVVDGGFSSWGDDILVTDSTLCNFD